MERTIRSYRRRAGPGPLGAIAALGALTLLALSTPVESPGRLPSPVAPAASSAGTPGSSLLAGDWPAYLYDGTRSGHSPFAVGFGDANASALAPRWEHQANGFIAASTVVAGGTAFVGSWDGYEYALNATTGRPIWRTYLNVTTTANCLTPRGVSSTPTVAGGTVYLGGGGEYWYALNATSGSILWSVYVGNNSTTGGHYNWASPLIYDGFAYIGVASDCDTPLVQGGLLQVDLSSHAIVHVFNTSTKLAHGASVWGSPTVDPALNLVYIATGNGGQYGASLVALNATTLALNGSWHVPANQSLGDGDFGATPTVFSDAAGRTYVGVANKNGIFYAFHAARVSAGPVWEDRVAVAGVCPECGQGSISPAAFNGTDLFVAGGATTIDGTNYSGAVRCLDPATGTVLWQHGAPGPVLGGLATAGGFVLDAAGPDLEVLNASTGARLVSYPADASMFAAPSVADGLVYVSSAAGTTYALAPATGHWSPTFSPPGSMNASMAYDAADGDIVEFGGCAADLCPSLETWTWNHGTWTNETPRIPNASNAPSARIDAAVAFDAADGYLVLFGGYSPASGDHGDTWEYRGGVWTLLSSGHGPSPRSDAAMAYDPAIHKVVLFGGVHRQGSTRTEYGDTWEFAGGKWASVKTPGKNTPSPRDAAGFVYYPTDGTVFLFGGRDASMSLNDSWELTGSKWTPLHPKRAPPSVFGAAFDYDNSSRSLLLVGGHESGSTVTSATWTYSAGTWSLRSSTTGPSARSGASLAFDGRDGDSLLYGGATPNGQPLADSWEFNGTAWVHVFPTDPGIPRYGAGGAYDAADGYLVIFGGHGATSAFYASTSRFTGTGYAALCSGCVAGRTEPSARDFPAMAFDASDAEVVLFGGQGPAGPLGDTWTYSAGRWTNLTGSLGVAPSARSGADLAYDAADRELVLFGGLGPSGVLNDTWEFHAGAWSRAAPLVSPPAREGGGMAYDNATSNLVLFGGNNGTRLFGDTWEFSNGSWARVAVVGGPGPRTNAGLAGTVEAGASSVLLVGGVAGGTYLSDVWRFAGGSWTPVFRGLSPTPRAAPVLAYDPVLAELVLFGGETGQPGALFAAGDTWSFGTSP